MPELRQTNANSAQEQKGEKETLSKPTAGLKRRVKRRLSAERPSIWVGKSGVSQELIKETSKQLNKNEMVKVKILKTALGTDEAKAIATRIAEQTEAFLVEIRGHTFMLYKRRKK